MSRAAHSGGDTCLMACGMGLAAEVCIQAYTDPVQGKLVPEEEGRPLRGKDGLTEREGLLSETLVQIQTR